MNAASIAAMLPDESGMRSKRCVDSVVARSHASNGFEQRRIAPLAEGATWHIEATCTERRSGGSPCCAVAVAVAAAGARLCAKRDELGEIRNRSDVARLRYAHESMRVEVVAKEQRRGTVGWIE
jgi:hypothetical protein